MRLLDCWRQEDLFYISIDDRKMVVHHFVLELDAIVAVEDHPQIHLQPILYLIIVPLRQYLHSLHQSATLKGQINTLIKILMIGLYRE